MNSDSIKTGQVEHGGNLAEFAARFKINENEIIDFSSNVNPLALPESVRRLYLESIHELTRYPDPSSSMLRDEITNLFPVSPEHVLCGNGAMALLGLAVRTLAPKRALVIEPSFGEYRRILEQQGTDVLGLELREQDDFCFNLPDMVKVLKNMDMLVIGHPNNPTGTALSRPQMLELIEAARQAEVFVLIDEAFADWAPEISVMDAVRDDSNFLVVRSLTKFFALAGLRSGFAIGPSELILEMKKNQDTWSLNRLAEKLSTAMLRDHAFHEWSRRWFQKESAVFRNDLKTLGVFKVYPGLANFVLVRLKPEVASTGKTFQSRNDNNRHCEETRRGDAAISLFKELGKKGIYIRPAGNFRGLDASYYRFAVRQRAENRLLMEGIRECLQLSVPSFSTL